MKLEEYKSYAEFCDADQALLRALWPHVEPRTQEVVEAFYDKVLAHESTRDIIQDPAQVERLKDTLQLWLAALLQGPWDAHYEESRRVIGRVHVRVGVSHAAMFMAMAAVQDGLLTIAREAGLPDLIDTCAAIRKVTMLDLGLMTSTYHTLQAQAQVRDAQAVLVSHLPSAAFLLDADGIVLAATPTATALVDAEVEGRPYHEAISPELVAAADFGTHLQEALSSGLDVHVPGIECDIDGMPTHLSVTLIPYDEPERGVVAYVENHTAAVESERRARRAEHLAQIGTLSATIAHELRNPLAGISGALQILRSEFDEQERMRSIIDRVLEQVRNLNQLVTDLLAYARTDREPQPQAGTDLADLAREVLDGLSMEYPNVVMRVRGNPRVSTDPAMVRQILWNLGTNACQAMGGRGEIRVACTTESISICDDGPGIDDDAARRAFEPFFTTKVKGTGLGLAVSAKVANAMGGELEYVPPSSRAGQGDTGWMAECAGACFRLWLRRRSSA